MTFVRALVTLVRHQSFRRLLTLRVVTHSADGIFQAALADVVLFNPEHAAGPKAMALAFAAVLLPYSLVGPFAGVLLDRWSRRRTIAVSQLVRAGAMLGVTALLGHGVTPVFAGAVLIVFSVNRFILAGLSAATPHTVPGEELVSANAVAPATGSLAFALGLGLGGIGAARWSDTALTLTAAGLAALSAAAAARLPFVGPDLRPGVPSLRAFLATLAAVASGLVHGARRLPGRVWRVLGVVLVTRLPFGVLLIATVLLYRGPFADAAVGLPAVGGAAAAGFAGAVVLAPRVVHRIGAVRGLRRWLVLGGLLVAALALPGRPWSLAGLALVIGLLSQLVKITCDTLVQRWTADDLLGRAFAFYDVAFNGGMVLAATVGALVLPPSGYSAWTFVLLGGLYVVLGVAAARRAAGDST